MEWRIYTDGALPGPDNMARDSHLLDQVEAGAPPALRLYGWAGHVLSVGHAQKVGREINLAACAQRGVPLVRRPTGGRAVLHGDDLTYAVIAPTGLPPFEGGILPVYKALAEVFTHFLRGLGLEPRAKEYAGREQAALASAICFATPAAFEMLVDGRKLIGSAQRMRQRAFLQHGSLPLRPQFALLEALFHGAREDTLRAQMTDLETLGALPADGSPGLARRLAESFSEVLGVRFTPGEWSAEDEAAVRARAAGLLLAPGAADAPTGAGGATRP